MFQKDGAPTGQTYGKTGCASRVLLGRFRDSQKGKDRGFLQLNVMNMLAFPEKGRVVVLQGFAFKEKVQFNVGLRNNCLMKGVAQLPWIRSFQMLCKGNMGPAA